MTSPNLLDAIRVVKGNERQASDNYAEAAKNIQSPMGKELFERLSAFEEYHYEKLTAVEKSLEEKGDFIHYEGREFPLPPQFDVKAAHEPNQKSVMTIISQAMELERQAEKAYADLAAQLTDPRGHQMFVRLSEEEHHHYLILTKAYWNMNNLGIWSWSDSKPA